MAAARNGARQDGGHRDWSIVGVAVLAQVAANGLAINAMSLFLHDWSRDLHAPISQLLPAMLPLGFVTALASPMIGALADKVSAPRHPASSVSGPQSPRQRSLDGHDPIWRDGFGVRRPQHSAGRNGRAIQGDGDRKRHLP